jgi:hypothetical protein
MSSVVLFGMHYHKQFLDQKTCAVTSSGDVPISNTDGVLDVMTAVFRDFQSLNNLSPVGNYMYHLM